MNKFSPNKIMADAIRLPMLPRKGRPGVKQIGLYLVARSTLRTTSPPESLVFDQPSTRGLVVPEHPADVRYIRFSAGGYFINQHSTFARFASDVQEALTPRLVAESQQHIVLADPKEAVWSFYLKADSAKHTYLHLKITPRTWEAVKDRVLNDSSGMYWIKVVAHLQHSGVVTRLRENYRDIDKQDQDHALWESGMLFQFRNSKITSSGGLRGTKSMRHEAAWFENTSGFPQCVVM